MNIKKENPTPMIMVATKRNKEGKLLIGSIPFKPGMVLQRCGRRYQVGEDGVQRRMR